MKNLTVPYFVIYSGEYKVFRGKLTEEEILQVFDKLSDIGVLGMSNIEFANEFQELYFEKLFAQYEKNLKAYRAKVENGKKGGRPKNTSTNNTPSKTEEDNAPPPPPSFFDITCNTTIEKVFGMYKEFCPDLKPLKYERRSRDILDLVAQFLTETNNDFEYLKEVCIKANALKVICDNALDFKGVIRNHIAIFNDKFKKGGENIGTKLKFN